MIAEKFHNKSVLVTAGPTFEKIDPVRFIGNFSTGKMGFAIAEAFAELGAKVTLVCGPVSLQTELKNITRIDVISADEMFHACLQYYDTSDICVMAAAVADYKPVHQELQKIKKSENTMTLELEKTQDILYYLGKNKKPGQILAGFALETINGIEFASEKLSKKNLDLIILNTLEDEGAGFQYDTNKINIIDKFGNIFIYKLKSKKEVAQDILKSIALQI